MYSNNYIYLCKYLKFRLFIKMKHYTLVQSIKIWRSVWVGSRPTVRQRKAKKVGSGRFGNAKGRSITIYNIYILHQNAS